MKIIDPFKFKELCWPDVVFYKEQKQIIRSVQENDETYVPAGNQLGKDFVAAFIALWFFCSRRPSRVLTTSVKFDQLADVLWGEIRRFIETSKVNLPIRATHLHLRQIDGNGNDVPLTELVGQVSNTGEGLLGRHAARGPEFEPTTLAIFDEASGIDDVTFNSTETWAHRKLVIGNPFPCANFFYRGVKAGDVEDEDDPGKFLRKVIKIKALDSPNVKLGIIQQRKGEKPTNHIIIPGVKSFTDYKKHRQLWDERLQTIGLDAEFYEGDEVLLYPPGWLLQSNQQAIILDEKYKHMRRQRVAKAIGCDPAEGGDDTVWCVIDEFGILEMIEMKTTDTSKISEVTKQLLLKYKLQAQRVMFDAGGGGKQHADYLRAAGLNVKTVAFGESAYDETMGPYSSEKKAENDHEERYVFKNRRAQMYGALRHLLNPDLHENTFAIPAMYFELTSQLAPIPFLLDDEGRMYLPSKRQGTKTQPSLVDIIGRSPDHADALVLAIYGMQSRKSRKKMQPILSYSR